MKKFVVLGKSGPWQSKCQVVQFVIVFKSYSIELSISASVYQISNFNTATIIINNYYKISSNLGKKLIVSRGLFLEGPVNLMGP